MAAPVAAIIGNDAATLQRPATSSAHPRYLRTSESKSQPLSCRPHNTAAADCLMHAVQQLNDQACSSQRQITHRSCRVSSTSITLQGM